MLYRLFLVVLVGAMLPTIDAEAQNGIPWVNSPEAAKTQAAQSQRLVLLHFYSDDCGPCRRLDSQVFPQSQVQQAVQRGYVAAKINTSKDPQTAKLYNVYTWPTDIVVDARGRELYRTISPQDANQYVRMLNATLASYQANMPYNAQMDRSQLGGSSQLGAGMNAAANNVGQYGQAADEQLRQTQQYAQHVANQYQSASQNLYGQAQQASQDATAQAQNQLAQSREAAQQYAQQYAQSFGQGMQQTAEKAAGAAQSQLAAAQQTAQQYGQNLSAYGQQAAQTGQQAAQTGQQAAQSVAEQAAAAQQTARQATQQGAETFNQYGQQAMQAANQTTGAAQQAFTNAQQAASQAAQGLYGQSPATNPAAQTTPAAPYSPAYDPSQNTPPQIAGTTAPAQAPPYGQMTSNPYVTQNPAASAPPAAAPARQPQGTANPYMDPATVAENPSVGGATNPPVGNTAPPATASYQQLYANQNGGNPGNSATQPASPPISPAPAYEPNKPRPLGMDGYCPVTLMTKKKWAKGDVRFGAVHRSRTYLFHSEAEQKQFMEDPDRYAPMLSGYDAVAYRKTGQLVEGRRDHGLTFMNHMFLFESEESLAEFAKSPQIFLGVVQQAMQDTPQRAVR